MSDESTHDTVRWYTRARRFPQLIGRTPDGTKLPGGPYTITQAVGAGLVLFVGINTMGMWASYGLIGNTLLLLAVTYAVVFVLGRLPLGSRSPISVCTGVLRATTSPRTGKVAGRPIRLRRPHKVQHSFIVALPAGGAADTGPADTARAPVTVPAPEPIPATPAPALTSVQALLAGYPTKEPR
ncbi:hypothetical protein [Nocardioides sp.]|uniref:hypothetical protein n=1 Tax=Nocardioides sp. TaxID=35761 RepID=UPI0027345AA1|nr:hypothetical protein [Nocardioides sp.]MDP3893615.1 hypothetical protein [Nocardioides sp.]